MRARAVWRVLLGELCAELEQAPSAAPPGLLDAQLGPAPVKPRPLPEVSARVSLMRVLVDALAQPVPFTDTPGPQAPGTPTSRPPRRARPDYGT